jgi:hypothetical protein
MPGPTSVQAILDLFRKSDIEFQLRGLLGVDRSTVCDVYSPEVRRSPTTHRMTVTHLDLVTCWKGLSYAQAAEILFWENVFRLSLERVVWDVVTRLFARQAREDNGQFARNTLSEITLSLWIASSWLSASSCIHH